MQPLRRSRRKRRTTEDVCIVTTAENDAFSFRVCNWEPYRQPQCFVLSVPSLAGKDLQAEPTANSQLLGRRSYPLVIFATYILTSASGLTHACCEHVQNKKVNNTQGVFYGHISVGKKKKGQSHQRQCEAGRHATLKSSTVDTGVRKPDTED